MDREQLAALPTPAAQRGEYARRERDLLRELGELTATRYALERRIRETVVALEAVRAVRTELGS